MCMLKPISSSNLTAMLGEGSVCVCVELWPEMDLAAIAVTKNVSLSYNLH